MLKELIVSDKELYSLLPTFSQRQEKLDNLWREALGKSGLNISCLELNFRDLNSKFNVSNLIELPPYLRLGRLSVNKNKNLEDLAEVQSYLDLCDFPALLHFREKSAILTFSEIDHKRIARLLQKQVIQLFCNLDPSVISCTGIDLINFGADFSLLMSAVPTLKVINDSRDMDEFFRGIPESLKERNKTKGFAHEYLYSYNKAHKDSTVPYHFVFISSYENNLGDEQKLVIERLMNNENAAKAGFYFVINFNSEKEFRNFSKKNPNLPIVVELGNSASNSKLQISDKSGLNNTDDGSFSVLNVIQDKDDLNTIKDLTDFCRKHLKAPRPDPVLFELPDSINWQEKGWLQTSEMGISVIIGKSKGQEIEFVLGGENGIVHNALIGGAVGTGKTNLLHSIILQTLALYSPEEIKLSILDYKSGTEFGAYKKVPHIYAISLGGGTQFGVDLLMHFQAERERRAEAFKEHNVSDIASYRKKTGIKLPRHVVVIDEFQVLFANSEQAKTSLEDLIRRGRSFGFNFILSSQSLKDASLTSPTKANIGVRICLRLSEADCSDFLSIDNDLPSRFNTPGQAVYNDREGRREANIEFRVAYYSEEVMTKFFRTLQISASSSGFNTPQPFIYEEESVLIKTEMEIIRPANAILLGYQEGIPRTQRFMSLEAASGPILILGIGKMRDAFEKHFKDELNTLNSEDYLDVESNNVEAYLAQVDSLEVMPPKILILRLKNKEANSPIVQNAIGNFLVQSETKLILIMDSKSALRPIYTLDERSAALVVYLDQKSIDGFGFDLKGQIGSVAALFPDESDLLVIKIPSFIKE